MENRDKDKAQVIYPSVGSRAPAINLDILKSQYIASGLSETEIADKYCLSVTQVNALIEEHNLKDLRQAYIREGVEKLQNVQLGQSHKLLDIELNFKKMRILQLEAQLNDFLAYYARHNDFYKRHPITGEILKDTNDIPMQIKIPDVSREINQLKESITMSEGLKQMLNRLDDILNTDPNKKPLTQSNVVVLNESEFNSLFEPGEKE